MKKNCIKLITFSFVFFLLLQYYTIRYVPKGFYSNTMWSNTSTYQGFYDMDSNTIDVIFLGSSAGSCAFIPQELYNNYGITSYNLSCQQQNMISSYYWLKEALRFQMPKVVVLESRFIFENDEEKIKEEWFRKVLDYMKMSEVKRETISTICEILEDQTEISYYFPIIRYHSRWEEIEKEDTYAYYLEGSSHHEFKGYTPTAIKATDQYLPVVIDETVPPEKVSELEMEYLDKIVHLCSDNNIDIILTYNPTLYNNTARHNTLNEYAKENKVIFIDFNEEHILSEMNYSYNEDNQNPNHCNLWGAKKLTNYLGAYLHEQLGIVGHESDKWEDTRIAYSGLEADYNLKYITDIDQYLEVLCANRDRYIIFISVKNEATNNLSDETIEIFRKLGLQANLKEQYKCSYLAVIDNTVLVEKMGYALYSEAATISRECWYTISSGGAEKGNISSINVNDKEYAKNSRGFNIVVYEKATGTILDSVCFDTYAEDNACRR